MKRCGNQSTRSLLTRLLGAAGLVAALLATPGRPALASASLNGLWLTEDEDVIIEIGPCSAALCGRIVWIQGAADARNEKDADPQRRSLPLCGLTVVSGIRPNGTAWRAATLYDPEDGTTYRDVDIVQADNRLRLTIRVFVFSQSTTWTRPARAVDRCRMGESRP